MSEPIIIETPQPPVRERLTVTRLPDALGGPSTRDATTEDLERAGWASVAEIERLREERSSVVRVKVARAKRILGATDDECIELAAERVVRERDEARATAKAARAPGALCKELDRREAEHAHKLLAQAERERDEARAEALSLREEREDYRRSDGQIRRMLAPLLGLGETEESAEVMVSRLRCDLDRATDREDGLATERARIVASLRHDAEYLAWPIGTSPNEALREAARRIERGDHAGTPVPAAEPRATDEELADVYNGAFHAHAGDVSASRLAAVHAVAARVRREQCLVTRAVEANVDIRVCEDDGGGFMVGVHAPGDDEDLERNVPAADVPATLARLLDEVTRG